MHSPELTLLLALIRHTVEPEQVHELAEHASSDGLAALAAHHGVSSLLYRGLSSLHTAVPPALASLTPALAAHFAEDALYYEFLYPQEIAGLLAAYGSAGIPTLLLKGHALGITVYSQPSLRPYGDIDLLVRESDLDAAENLMLRLGYTFSEDEHPRDWYRSQHHHLAPFVRTGCLPVEVHRALVTPGNSREQVDLKALWAAARSLEIGGQPAHILCPEHQLIYLCLHAVNTHFFEMGLKALCDVHESVTQPGLDWDRIVQEARSWHCARQVALMLRLVSDLFHTRLPPEAGTIMRDQPDARLITYSMGNVMATAVAGMPQAAGLAQVMEEKSLGRRILRALRRLFPSRNEIAARYRLKPSSISVWLAYPRWQIDIVRRHAPGIWHMLRTGTGSSTGLEQEASRRALVDWLSGI